GLAGGRSGGPRLGELSEGVVAEALVGDGRARVGFVDRRDVAGGVVGVVLGKLFDPGAGGGLVFGFGDVLGEPAGGLVDGGGEPDPFGAGAEGLLVGGAERVVAGGRDVGVLAGGGQRSAGAVVAKHHGFGGKPPSGGVGHGSDRTVDVVAGSGSPRPGQ